MLDITLIREKPEWVKEQLAKRGFDFDYREFLSLDSKTSAEKRVNEETRAFHNKISAEIGKLSPGKDREDLVKEAHAVVAAISKSDERLIEYAGRLKDFTSALPNIPLAEVQPGGKESNKVVVNNRNVAPMPKFNFTPKDHVELCTKLGLIDYERAAKMSGAGSWIYTGMGARLEWALFNYFVDFHTANGYTFIMPPHLLNHCSGYTAGQFPKFTEEIFCTTIGDERTLDTMSPKFRFLLPTSETALINLHRNEIIDPERLPFKYFAFSPCYRKEAGSYRTSERGMMRGIQFNKVEMFAFCRAEDDEAIFNEFVNNAQTLVEGLGLHYQTVALAAGDVSASMAKTYDIEVYIPSMHGYKEISSVSTAGDYQARRAMIRTHAVGNSKQKSLVYTLNASGLATSRLIPAIVEQFQTKDGRVAVPVVLQKYLGGIKEL